MASCPLSQRFPASTHARQARSQRRHALLMQCLVGCSEKLAAEEKVGSLEQQLQEAHSMLDEQRAWAANLLQDDSTGREEKAALQAQAQHLTQASPICISLSLSASSSGHTQRLLTGQCLPSAMCTPASGGVASVHCCLDVYWRSAASCLPLAAALQDVHVVDSLCRARLLSGKGLTRLVSCRGLRQPWSRPRPAALHSSRQNVPQLSCRSSWTGGSSSSVRPCSAGHQCAG